MLHYVSSVRPQHVTLCVTRLATACYIVCRHLGHSVLHVTLRVSSARPQRVTCYIACVVS